jgi:hypothetical protein
MSNLVCADSFEEGAVLKLRGLPFARAELRPGSNRVALFFDDVRGDGGAALNRYRLGQEQVPARDFAECLAWARKTVLNCRDGVTARRERFER